MEKSFWDRYQELRESINGGVEPMDDIKLETRTVKIALGIYLIQSVIVALWWSIETSSVHPWMTPICAFLGVGWFWNKVTESWKYARGFRYQRVEQPPPPPPPLRAQTTVVMSEELVDSVYTDTRAVESESESESESNSE